MIMILKNLMNVIIIFIPIASPIIMGIIGINISRIQNEHALYSAFIENQYKLTDVCTKIFENKDSDTKLDYILETTLESQLNTYEYICYGYIENRLNKKSFLILYKSLITKLVDDNENIFNTPNCEYVYIKKAYYKFKCK